jgi:hypothetical protein
MLKKLTTLTPSEFENLVFDLVQVLGMKNCVWRTPGRDGGRDIQGEWFIQDLSGQIVAQSWYVECKRHEASVGWPSVWEKISYAESNGADVLLVAVSSSLSPQAVDEVNKWNNQRKSPSVRFWNGVDVETKLRLFPTLEVKYGLSLDPQRDKATALLPVINILLKYSYASHAAEVFMSPSPRKLAVLYSITELVASRLADIEASGGFLVHPFRKDKDSYDWLVGAELFDEIKLDRYAARVLVCYLRDYLRCSHIQVARSGKVIYIEVEHSTPEHIQDDLRQIALISNMELSHGSNQIQGAHSHFLGKSCPLIDNHSEG